MSEFLSGSPVSRPERRVVRIRHELRQRQLTVTRVERLSPSFVSVTLAGTDLAGFASLSFDDHLKLFLSAPDGEPARRDYTPRHFDRVRNELTLEFVVHGHGLAAAWATSAKPGDTVTIGGPRGSMVIPVDHSWHLLAGDASALPAMHRRLEELPAGSRAIVLAEVPDVADVRTFDTRAELSVQWVHDAPGWLNALRALELPDGDGFIWCAGEGHTMARASDHLIGERGHPAEASKIAAYWKSGEPGFHGTL